MSSTAAARSEATAAAGGDIDVRNPATGAPIGSVPDLDHEQVASLVARARAAQPAWAARSAQSRCATLGRIRAWVRENAEQVIETLVAETGKPWEDAALADVTYVSHALAFWERNGPRWLADERVGSSSPAVVGRRLVVRYAAHGVVAVIAPWNYPLANGFGDCIPALAAGNAVVLKPSEETPLSTVLMERALRACGVPDGVFCVATGRGDTGAALIDHVDMVMFTGSTATGRKVAERAGRNLIPASLELGGKDPMLVLRDADIERASNAAVQYAFQNSGQQCIAVERVYVEGPVYDDFVGRVTEKVRALRQGDPAGGFGTVELGAMTFPAQADLVERHVDEAVSRGARALTGGRRGAGPGTFYEPTVLVDVDHSMACMREETFGPTLPIVRVEDADEAIRLANDSDFGLGASVYTADRKRGEAIARRLEAGNVAINDAMVFFAALELPMGGWKTSGVGTRHAAGGIRKYCRTQSIVVGRQFPRRDLHMFPYGRRRSRAIVAIALRGGAAIVRRAPVRRAP